MNLGIPDEINHELKFSESQLWEIPAPIEQVELKFLNNNLKIRYLDKMGTDDWNLTPIEIIKNPEKEPDHYAKILKSDLDFPIDITFFNNQWIILDGVHRFCKAHLQKKQTIKVRKHDFPKLKSLK